MARRNLGGDTKRDNRRALIFAAVGIGFLLIAYVGTHMLNGNSSKSASDSIRSSISTATTLPVRPGSGVTLRHRIVTAVGPQPNTTRNPFAVP